MMSAVPRVVQGAATARMAEAPMTRDELAAKLDQLDPGATLAVEERELARVFSASSLTSEVVKAAEALAIEHRCAFAWNEPGRRDPIFEKDDVF
jgi:hypothetical protein